MSGAGTVLSKECSAKVGQIGDPGMRGSGTTRAVSPAWKVFVLVMVIRAPEFFNVMLFLESVLREEKVSSDGGTKFAVRKNVKKPTRQADHKDR